MANINDTYFDGYYKDIWRTIIPAELTPKEVDFIIPYFKLEAGSKILDLMCGYGRHAVALASKGMEVTAVDNLAAYIDEVNKSAREANVKVNAVQTDVLEFAAAEKYDLAICMGNSLNFFDATDTEKLFSNIASCLNTGGHLLINSWSIAEIAFKNFKEKSWSTVGEVKFLTDSKILFQPTRVETQSIFIASDGTTEVKDGVDYIFSLNEIEAMLNVAGFTLKEVYSIPGRKKFTVGEPRAYLVAEKNV